MTYRCQSPVLFLVFNRPAVTRRVFEAIRRAQPYRLYVACDGPRPDCPSDTKLIEEVRNITESTNWPCKQHFLFRQSNLGCGRAVSEAVDWFFKNEPEGIVLEDDCLPADSFFRFCDELLQRYRRDERIGLISGSYSLPTSISAERESYFLARYGRIWGWASWRRAWQGYDLKINLWPKIKQLQSHRCFFERPEHADHYEKLWDRVYAGEIDTWDYQWELKRLVDCRFTLVSSVNLIDNIGFDCEATHTKTDAAAGRRKRREICFPLVHPAPLLMDYRRDRETHCHRYQTTARRLILRISKSWKIFTTYKPW